MPIPARSIICDERHSIYYSAVSIWELSIKHSMRPNSVTLSAGQLIELCRVSGYIPLPMRARHATALETLARDPSAPPHKDPFDRMLIAQAKSEGMTFLTHDSLLPAYNEPCILFV